MAHASIVQPFDGLQITVHVDQVGDDGDVLKIFASGTAGIWIVHCSVPSLSAVNAGIESVEWVGKGETRIDAAVDLNTFNAQEMGNTCAEAIVFQETVELRESARELVVSPCTHVGINLVVKSTNSLHVGLGKRSPY